MSERYVQHKSGQGEKWKVEESNLDKYQDCWVHKRGPDQLDYFLPKSEFIECEPPEVWTECTREVVADNLRNIVLVNVGPDERFAWRGDALVIERRKP